VRRPPASGATGSVRVRACEGPQPVLVRLLGHDRAWRRIPVLGDDSRQVRQEESSNPSGRSMSRKVSPRGPRTVMAVYCLPSARGSSASRPTSLAGRRRPSLLDAASIPRERCGLGVDIQSSRTVSGACAGVCTTCSQVGGSARAAAAGQQLESASGPARGASNGIE
jgi:hypothetical protein